MAAMVRNRWKTILLVFALLLLVILVVLLWLTPPPLSTSSQLQILSLEELQQEKLRQEIIKLRLESTQYVGVAGLFSQYATTVTALVAIAGIIITIWKQISETSRQRDLDRKQRQEEDLRRTNDKFTSIITNLGAESEALQASAAVSITNFLRAEYKDFHNQVYELLLANLKIEHTPAINRLLIQAFQQAIRTQLPQVQQEDRRYKLNLALTHISHIDLSGLDISDADIAFAEIRYGNLTGTNLWRAWGIEVNLEKSRLNKANLNEARFRKARLRGACLNDANLVAANLREADLREAELRGARLQSAHLEGADLRGAKFDGANLSDTYLRGAILDSIALDSILNNLYWTKAHLDAHVIAEIEAAKSVP